jgi:hypothetical protein
MALFMMREWPELFNYRHVSKVAFHSGLLSPSRIEQGYSSCGCFSPSQSGKRAIDNAVMYGHLEVVQVLFDSSGRNTDAFRRYVVS